MLLVKQRLILQIILFNTSNSMKIIYTTFLCIFYFDFLFSKSQKYDLMGRIKKIYFLFEQPLNVFFFSEK